MSLIPFYVGNVYKNVKILTLFWVSFQHPSNKSRNKYSTIFILFEEKNIRIQINEKNYHYVILIRLDIEYG